MERKERKTAESRADSAKSQNLVNFNPCEAPNEISKNSGKVAESRVDSALKAEFVAESRNEKKGTRGFKRIKNAFFYSLSGLKTAFCEEEAFRQILLISAILIPLGAYLGESFAEKVLLILPCILAILCELANSAIENAIDFAGLEIHPFAKNAKDMGSAMQFIACLFMGGVWIFYLIQRLLI